MVSALPNPASPLALRSPILAVWQGLITPGTVTKAITAVNRMGPYTLAFSSAATDFDYLSVGEKLTSVTYTLTWSQ